MLFLLFQLGNDRYCLETKQIIEVLPMVRLKQILQAPPCVAGVFAHRDTIVPVIDVSQLIVGHPAKRRLSTRIIIFDYTSAKGDKHPLGLLAEGVSGTIKRQASDFSHVGVDTHTGPYLGPVTRDDLGLVQWVEVESLLAVDLQDLLFREPAEKMS